MTTTQTVKLELIEAKTAKELIENINRFVSYKASKEKSFLANEPYVSIVQDREAPYRWHAFLGFDIQVEAR